MTSIFVAKLDFGVSDDSLKELFERHGTVLKCQIAKDRETGKPRGFAFVEMKTPEETQAAIRALDGHTINGRAMVVKLAEDRGSGKPSAAPRPQNRSNTFNRPQTPRDSDESPKKPVDGDFKVPFQAPDETSSSESTFFEKPTKRGKNKKKKAADDKESRETKMSAYKKSGKKSRIEFDDDDDWELEFRKNQKRGWSDDDDEI